MTSQVDFKRAFNKMKHDLESWRGLIIATDSILKWKKNYHPVLIFSAVSTFYLSLWMAYMSTLTMLSVFGLFWIAFDIAYPSISRLCFNADNWNGTKETQFEEVCAQLCTIKMKFASWYEFVFTAKERKSTAFVIVVSISLLALAYVGAIMDNFLLMYMITVIAVMYPGINEQGVLDRMKRKFGRIVNSKLQQIREISKKSD